MQFDHLKRREFIALLGGAAAWPLAARAQQAGKLPTIGILGATTALFQGQQIAAFIRRLRELGWIEGRTVAIEYRWAEGRDERYAEIASEFVRLKVDVIVTWGTASVVAVKRATAVIPIVFAGAGDPVATDLVASLARPGSNVTGLSVQIPDLAGKRLELLHEISPDLRRLAVLSNIGSPIGVLEMGEVQAAARTLGLEVLPLEIRQAEDIAPIRVHSLALGARLPTLHGLREFVEARSDVVWAECPGFVSPLCRHCRQDSARREAGRHSRRATDQIRPRHQCHDRQGTRPRRAAERSRRRSTANRAA